MTSTHWDLRSLTSSRAAANFHPQTCGAETPLERELAARLKTCPPGSSLVRDHPFYFEKIPIAYQYGLTQVTLASLGFRTEHVPQIRLMALYFASPSFLEALGSAFMCFEFRH